MLLNHWSPRSKLLLIASCFLLTCYIVFGSRLGYKLRNCSSKAGLCHVLNRDHGDISNETLGFQKLFVINLPSRTDRKDAVSLAASTSNIKIDFINGVLGDAVPAEALPPGGSSKSVKLAKGIRGSWRSHMNALQEIVLQNLTTAVVFEDDVDWDIRVREQLGYFASASQVLSKSSLDLSQYPIFESPNPETEESIHNDTSDNKFPPMLYSLPLSKINSFPTVLSSSYGNPESWDVLWLGHCGAGFPRPAQSNIIDERNVLLTLPNDYTVPQPKFLQAHPFGPLDPLSESHPPHTRVFHRASGGALCTVAYAVSQRGARRLLHQFGVKSWSRIFDVELGEWCAGSDSSTEAGKRVCITSQPPIFAHHHPLGGESNIGGLGGGYANSVETKYIRWSVRLNLEALVRADGIQGMKDQWPDEESVSSN